jgi:flagellar biosynthesis protein FliR
MAIFSVEGLLLMVHQLIIGASFGLTMRLVFAGVELWESNPDCRWD